MKTRDIYMENRNQQDEIINAIHQSIIDTKGKKNCLRDYSGDVFELTADMLANEYEFNQKQASELAGIAECILQKYSKLLSLKK